MSDASGSRTWGEELTSLVEDTGIQYGVDGIGVPLVPEREMVGSHVGGGDVEEDALASSTESFKNHMKEFLKGSAELLLELGRGCRDIIRQSLGKEDSYVARKLGGPWAKVSSRLSFMNEYLPEDLDPVHAWPVVISVFFIAFLVLYVNTDQQNSAPLPKKVYIPPPSAIRIELPDGRYISYQEQGVPVDKARFSLIAPHPFLSSRLAGLPGIKASLLEEFGVRLVTYDLPGFGESDPHPKRNLNTSALDMSYLATAVGVKEKFWVVGYSTAAMHSWAALRYIPDKIAVSGMERFKTCYHGYVESSSSSFIRSFDRIEAAMIPTSECHWLASCGAAMFSPMSNPYDSSMTKEERQRTWEKWSIKKKLMYCLSRRFPTLLPYFYRRSFLSGRYGHPDIWLSLSLGKKDRSLIEEPFFIEFWERDVAESVRQWNPKPFVEEAVLQVSHWGFSLAQLRAQRARQGKGLLSWLKSVYSPVERDWVGFLGPIHIWQGMDDEVVPPSMIDFIQRIVPRPIVHKLPGEGHFSYLYFCDECHRRIFSTLFGAPQGPLSTAEDEAMVSSESASETHQEETLVAEMDTSQG